MAHRTEAQEISTGRWQALVMPKSMSISMFLESCHPSIWPLIAHLYVLRAQICVCQLIDYKLFSAAAGWFHRNALDVSTAKSNTFSHADLNSQACCCGECSHSKYDTKHGTNNMLRFIIIPVLDAV